MQTQTITTYNFNELNEKAKEYALNKNRELCVSDFWWSDTFEGAKELGIKITEFDLDRAQKIKGEFIDEHIEVADHILDNWGESCQIYKIAEQFRKERDELCDQWQKDENGELDNIDELDEKLDELENQFEKDILWQYWILLRDEYEYLFSDEFLSDFLDNNEYQFTENGKMYNF